MGWTPLFLKADPQMTGKSFMAMVALRMPALSSATVGASPATYFSMRWSSPASEAASATLCDHLVAVELGLVQELGRDLDDLELGPQLLVQVADGLHLHEVDDPLVLVLLAQRELDGHRRLGVQAVVHGLRWSAGSSRPPGPSCS